MTQISFMVEVDRDNGKAAGAEVLVGDIVTTCTAYVAINLASKVEDAAATKLTEAEVVQLATIGIAVEATSNGLHRAVERVKIGRFYRLILGEAPAGFRPGLMGGGAMWRPLPGSGTRWC